MGIFKKKLWRQKRKSDKKAKGRANRAVIEQLEPRLLLSADLVVNPRRQPLSTSRSSLQDVDSIATVQIINNHDQQVVDSQALTETTGVVITGSDESDSVTVDLGSFSSVTDPFHSLQRRNLNRQRHPEDNRKRKPRLDHKQRQHGHGRSGHFQRR